MGRRCQNAFHVAEGIKQALGSVAECNDAGNMVLFDSSGDHKGSIILSSDTPEGKAIRVIAKKAQGKGTGTPMERIRNSYIIKMWLEAPTASDNSPSQGPGA